MVGGPLPTLVEAVTCKQENAIYIASNSLLPCNIETTYMHRHIASICTYI